MNRLIAACLLVATFPALAEELSSKDLPWTGGSGGVSHQIIPRDALVTTTMTPQPHCLAGEMLLTSPGNWGDAYCVKYDNIRKADR